MLTETGKFSDLVGIFNYAAKEDGNRKKILTENGKYPKIHKRKKFPTNKRGIMKGELIWQCIIQVTEKSVLKSWRR